MSDQFLICSLCFLAGVAVTIIGLEFWDHYAAIRYARIEKAITDAKADLK